MVSIITLVIAAIGSMAVGMFWYSKAGFGKTWMAETGMTEK